MGEMWAFFMDLCKLGEPARTSSHNGRVVQALKTDEVECICAGHKDAVIWILVGNQINGSMEKAWTFKWFGPELTTLAEKARKTPKKRLLAWANEKADKLT